MSSKPTVARAPLQSPGPIWPPASPSKNSSTHDASRKTPSPIPSPRSARASIKSQALLDLNYIEDKDAEVDANIVMTGRGQFVEVQSSGEETTFSGDQLQSLLALSQKV